jgi:hypothetical protein
MTPPPYVSIFQAGWIRVEGDLSSNPSLMERLVRIPFGFRGIRFDEHGVYTENISLIQAMLDLNDLGVAFGEDYKQCCDPYGFMKDLQKNHILKKSFSSIYWKGPGDWHLRENSLE